MKNNATIDKTIYTMAKLEQDNRKIVEQWKIVSTYRSIIDKAFRDQTLKVVSRVRAHLKSPCFWWESTGSFCPKMYRVCYKSTQCPRPICICSHAKWKHINKSYLHRRCNGFIGIVLIYEDHCTSFGSRSRLTRGQNWFIQFLL